MVHQLPLLFASVPIAAALALSADRSASVVPHVVASSAGFVAGAGGVVALVAGLGKVVADQIADPLAGRMGGDPAAPSAGA